MACSVYDEALLPRATGDSGQRGGSAGAASDRGGGGTTPGLGGTSGSAGDSDPSAGSGGQDGGAGGVDADGGAPDASGGVPGDGGTGNGGGSETGGVPSVAGSGAAGAGLGAGGNVASGGSSLGGTSGAGVVGSGGTPSGSVLFFDDFESGNSEKWGSSSSSAFSVVMDSSQVYRQSLVSPDVRIASAGSSWTDQVVEARVKVLEFGEPGSVSYFVALFARYVDDNNHYYLALRSDGRMAIRLKHLGSSSTLGSVFDGPQPIATGVWYSLRLEVVGTTLKAYLNSVQSGSVTDASIAEGKVAVGSYNASVQFDEVKVTAP